MCQYISRSEATVLKGIAVLSVILAHANGWKAFTGIPIKATTIFCSGGMCLFLILSGYGVFSSFSANGLERFWDKKFKKIMFPAILTQTMFYIFRCFYDYVQSGVIDLHYGTVLGDILAVNPTNWIDPSLWYLSYLFFCYTAFYLFFWIFKNVDIAFWLFTLFWICTAPFERFIYGGNGYYCVFAFWVGVAFSYGENHKGIKPGNLHKWVQAFFMVCFFVIGGCVFYRYYRVNRIFDNIACTLQAIAFIILFHFIDCGKLKVLSYIGKHSYMMYLLQGKVICWVFQYDRNYLSLPNATRTLAFVVLFSLNVVLSSAMDRIIDKIQSRDNLPKPNNVSVKPNGDL